MSLLESRCLSVSSCGSQSQKVPRGLGFVDERGLLRFTLSYLTAGAPDVGESIGFRADLSVQPPRTSIDFNDSLFQVLCDECPTVPLSLTMLELLLHCRSGIVPIAGAGMAHFTNIFRPLQLKNTTLRNRIVMGK